MQQFQIPAGLEISRAGDREIIFCRDCGAQAFADATVSTIRHSRRCDTPDLQVRRVAAKVAEGFRVVERTYADPSAAQERAMRWERSGLKSITIRPYTTPHGTRIFVLTALEAC